MSEFELRSDAVEVTGVITTAWVEPFDTRLPGPGTWHLVLQLVPGDPLLVAADGKVNVFGWLECQVTLVAPYRNEPNSGRLLAEMVGKKVRLSGSWGDVKEGGLTHATLISPIAWILVDQSALPSLPGDGFSVTPIIEEHGFSQVVRDVDLFAFSDDTPLALGVPPPPHHREDRHLEVGIPFRECSFRRSMPEILDYLRQAGALIRNERPKSRLMKGRVGDHGCHHHLAGGLGYSHGGGIRFQEPPVARGRWHHLVRRNDCVRCGAPCRGKA